MCNVLRTPYSVLRTESVMSRLCQAPKLPLKIGLTGIDRSKGIPTNHCHPFAPPQGTRGTFDTSPLTGQYLLIFHIPAQFLCFSDSLAWRRSRYYTEVVFKVCRERLIINGSQIDNNAMVMTSV